MNKRGGTRSGHRISPFFLFPLSSSVGRPPLLSLVFNTSLLIHSTVLLFLTPCSLSSPLSLIVMSTTEAAAAPAPVEEVKPTETAPVAEPSAPAAEAPKAENVEASVRLLYLFFVTFLCPLLF